MNDGKHARRPGSGDGRRAGSALLAALLAGIDRCVPLRVRSGDVDQVRRARLVVAYAWSLVTLAIVYSAVFFSMNSLIGGVTLAAGAGAAVVSLLVLHRPGSQLAAGNLLAAAFFGTLTALACRSGGTHAPVVEWYAAVPAVALSTTGRRSAIFWLAVTLATVAAFYTLDRAGYPFPDDLTPYHRELLHLLSFVGLIVLVLGLAAMYEMGQGRILSLAQKSEERFRRFAAASGYGFGMGELAGQVVLGNAAMVRIVEEDSEEAFTSNTFFQYYTPKDAERLEHEILPVVLEEGQWVGEIPLLSARGNLIATEQNIFLIRDEQGSPQMLGNIVTEITERKHAEEKLRKNEQFLQDMFDAIQDGLVVLDRDLNIVRANRWMQEMYAHEAPLEGRKCFSAFQQRDTVCPWCPTRKAIQTGETHSTEVPYPNAEDARGWIDLSAFPLKNERGEMTGVIEYVKDISDRKRVEQERKELITELEAQNAELERFTYTVSHDLKSPLITIKGFVGVLLEDLREGNSEAVSDGLTRISGAADKMDQLLQDLLELSRIGRLTNPAEDVSLEELAREALELVGGHPIANQVQVMISPDLPAVFGDRLRLLEVLQNLIDNALKYMGDQPRPEVEIGSRRDRDETIYYVRDNGIGIEPRYQDRVFRLFDQLDPDMEGSGVGLALVKRIVQLHGGRIWIESEGAGRGSTFCFTVAARGESSESGGAEPETAAL